MWACPRRTCLVLEKDGNGRTNKQNSFQIVMNSMKDTGQVLTQEYEESIKEDLLPTGGQRRPLGGPDV